MDYQVNPFTRFDQDWGLVTAGTKEKFNSMTISWGGMGTLWGKPVITIYIKPSRYTMKFLTKENRFTVSFFPKELKRKIHSVMGGQSGRDLDKVQASGITPRFTPEGITFEEAEETFYCQKIYVQKLDEKAIPEEVMKRFYPDKDPHYLFIGELIKHETK